MSTADPADRIVYGARCSWWDSISQASTTSTGLPCCPNCGSPLFEVDTEDAWWAGAATYEADGHPNYQAFLRWARGKCFPSLGQAMEAFEATEEGRVQPG